MCPSKILLLNWCLFVDILCGKRDDTIFYLFVLLLEVVLLTHLHQFLVEPADSALVSLAFFVDDILLDLGIRGEDVVRSQNVHLEYRI